MGNSISAAVPALCAAICAIDLVHFLDPHPVAGAAEAAQAPALGNAVRAFLPLSAAWGFFTTSVAVMYRHHHLHRAGAADAAGAGNQRLSERVPFMLCASAGLLELFLFVVQVPGGGGVDHSAAARELGRAALGALPYAATATFFLSMLMIIVGHIRAGGEGGGTAVAGNGPIEAPAGGILAKMAIGAAAGLVALMAMAALYGAY